MCSSISNVCCGYPRDTEIFTSGINRTTPVLTGRWSADGNGGLTLRKREKKNGVLVEKGKTPAGHFAFYSRHHQNLRAPQTAIDSARPVCVFNYLPVPVIA